MGQSKSHKNFMAGTSYTVSPLLTLRIAAASCFFGEPTFYGAKDSKPVAPSQQPQAVQKHLSVTLGGLGQPDFSGLTPSQRMEKVIDNALDADPEATLQEAVLLRKQGHIRTTPQVIMVRAARHPKVRGTGLIRQYAPNILSRGDESAVQLKYLSNLTGKGPIPNALKKAWAAHLSGMNEYTLAKYAKDGLTDVANVCHPAGNPLLEKLVKGKLSQGGSTWEAIVSKDGSTKEAWSKAVSVMGHMALLRNLRNFHEKGVDPAVYLDKLVNTAKDGKQLPFRYWSAYNALSEGSATTRQAIEECLKNSLGFLPFFKGKVASLCDNSGSAVSARVSCMSDVNVATIANLSALLTGYQSDEGWVGLFGDRLTMRQVDRSKAPLAQLAALNVLGKQVGGYTENGIWLFWDEAIRTKKHWDHVFVYSDMQAGHGDLYGSDPSQYKAFQWVQNPSHIDVARLIGAYRASVNPKVNVFLVQCAGYADAILPEEYYRTSILGGWGDGIFHYADQMTRLFDGLDASQAT